MRGLYGVQTSYRLGLVPNLLNSLLFALLQHQARVGGELVELIDYPSTDEESGNAAAAVPVGHPFARRINMPYG